MTIANEPSDVGRTAESERRGRSDPVRLWPGDGAAARAFRERLRRLESMSEPVHLIGSVGRVGVDIAAMLGAAHGRIEWLHTAGIPDGVLARDVGACEAGAGAIVISNVTAVGPTTARALASFDRGGGRVIGLSGAPASPCPDIAWIDVPLPSLGEAPGDLVEMIAHLWHRLEAVRPLGSLPSLDPPPLASLEGHVGSGGVDALEHALVRIRVFGDPALAVPRVAGEPADGTLDELERSAIERALDRHGGVQTRAARALGVSERALRYKLRKHGLLAARERRS